MALNVGINVVEVDGRASPSIQAAPTSVAAFVGLAERGVPNRPVRISSMAQFRERFGDHRTDAYLAFAVEGFYLNGGREAFVARVVGAGSTAASVNLNDRQATPAPTLRVAAGNRGQEAPGLWGQRLRIDVRDDPRGNTQLQAATATNATSAQLQSLDGFQVGRVVRFVDGAAIQHRRITVVEPATRTIRWDPTTPISAALGLATTRVTTAEFRLVVRFQATPTAEHTVVEEWPQVSMETDSTDYVVDRVNHPLTGSRFIVVSDGSGTTTSGIENPAVISNQPLVGGTENPPSTTDYIGVAGPRTGLFAFDTAQVQLVAIPDVHMLVPAGRDAVVRGALDYCAARGDCMYVGSAPDRGVQAGTVSRVPSDYTQLESSYVGTIKTYSAAFQASKVFGALYAPWIRVVDPATAGPAPARFVPPEGHVLGVYARTELERGIFKAPAGIAAQIRGALDVAATFTDEQHTDLVKNGLVNGVRAQPGLGIAVAASRTLSTDTRWRFVNVRLLFNFIKSSLRDGLRFVRQEPHTEDLRRSVRLTVVTPFLLGLWRQGAFGSDPAELVFSVKCDAENNPPSEVNLGNFRLEVYFYPVKPAETITIVVGQQPSGATTREA